MSKCWKRQFWAETAFSPKCCSWACFGKDDFEPKLAFPRNAVHEQVLEKTIFGQNLLFPEMLFMSKFWKRRFSSKKRLADRTRGKCHMTLASVINSLYDTSRSQSLSTGVGVISVICDFCPSPEKMPRPMSKFRKRRFSAQTAFSPNCCSSARFWKDDFGPKTTFPRIAVHQQDFEKTILGRKPLFPELLFISKILKRRFWAENNFSPNCLWTLFPNPWFWASGPRSPFTSFTFFTLPSGHVHFVPSASGFDPGLVHTLFPNPCFCANGPRSPFTSFTLFTLPSRS